MLLAASLRMNRTPSFSLTDDPYVFCESHGRRPTATLCIHLVCGLGRGFYRTCDTDSETEILEAVCMFCAMLDLEGRGWTTDELAVDNLRSVCDKCFDLAEARSSGGVWSEGLH